MHVEAFRDVSLAAAQDDTYLPLVTKAFALNTTDMPLTCHDDIHG
jgi:hypothetical protein